MGSLSDMMGMIPGLPKLKNSSGNFDEKQLVWIEAIIDSMTPAERNHPELINGSRRKRIARGAGKKVQDVNRLLKQFSQMRTMMKKLVKWEKENSQLVYKKGDSFLAVHIRLKRQGRKKRPFYRVVAIDSRSHREGREIERLGWYDPVNDKLAVEFKEDRVFHWLNEGAIPTDTVSSLLRKKGLAYKWHLIKSGVSTEQISAHMDEWAKAQLTKAEKNVNKKAVKSVTDSDDTLVDDAKAEDAPVEEVKVEDTAEEPKAEDAPVEEVKKKR